ncbi:Hypothetical_protein [Hexamita inflata]|uniref:Hypothetical_protein n=1 Tax=Hexamita inflata TaxID=28002 RepID=A0ABP1HX52_9EUKA
MTIHKSKLSYTITLPHTNDQLKIAQNSSKMARKPKNAAEVRLHYNLMQYLVAAQIRPKNRKVSSVTPQTNQYHTSSSRVVTLNSIIDLGSYLCNYLRDGWYESWDWRISSNAQCFYVQSGDQCHNSLTIDNRSDFSGEIFVSE